MKIMCFSRGPNRNVQKLTNLYGDELFTQIAYTPYVFDDTAQPDDAIDDNGDVIALQSFLDKTLEWLAYSWCRITNKTSG